MHIPQVIQHWRVAKKKRLKYTICTYGYRHNIQYSRIFTYNTANSNKNTKGDSQNADECDNDVERGEAHVLHDVSGDDGAHGVRGRVGDVGDGVHGPVNGHVLSKRS